MQMDIKNRGNWPFPGFYRYSVCTSVTGKILRMKTVCPTGFVQWHVLAGLLTCSSLNAFPIGFPFSGRGCSTTLCELTAAATVTVFHRFPFSSGCKTTRTPTWQRYESVICCAKMIVYILFTSFGLNRSSNVGGND